MNSKKIEGLKKLIQTKKFEADLNIFYPGAMDNQRNILNNCLNKILENFVMITEKEATQADYLQAIKQGLNKFEKIDSFDTEDRERICMYFEEIMDIIGLESSEGILNTWMYGFNF